MDRVVKPKMTSNSIHKSTIVKLRPQILANIFSRLPSKSIYSCRCVCKTFLNTISNSCFPRPNSLLLRSSKGEFSLLELGSNNHNNEYEHWSIKFKFGVSLPFGNLSFVGSSNGLVCFCSYSPSGDIVYVCNPIVGEYTTLPKRRRDNADSAITYGFGFCPVINRYKALRIVANSAKIEILTIGSKKWKIKAMPFPIFRGKKTFRMFDLNGALHWLDGRKYVYAFDLAQECIRHMALPFDVTTLRRMALRPLGGLLAITVCSKDCWLDIWYMKEYWVEKSWTKLQVIDIQGHSHFEPVAHWKKEEVLFWLGYCPEGFSPFVSYNMRIKKFIECKIYNSNWITDVFGYAPSFRKLEDVFKESLPRIVKLRR